MNYGELKTAWREWSHRNDLTDSILATIQEMTTVRLGRDLRILENEISELITVPPEGYDLGVRFREMRTVQTSKQKPSVAYMTPDQFKESRLGQPQVWTIENGIFFLDAPGDISIDYWHEPERMSADNDTNDVLAVWSNIYIYGGLIEIFRFTQDDEMAIKYGAFYEEELRKTNEQAQRARIGNAPAMRAV